MGYSIHNDKQKFFQDLSDIEVALLFEMGNKTRKTHTVMINGKYRIKDFYEMVKPKSAYRHLNSKLCIIEK
jgi:hypothetical protein